MRGCYKRLFPVWSLKTREVVTFFLCYPVMGQTGRAPGGWRHVAVPLNTLNPKALSGTITAPITLRH